MDAFEPDELTKKRTAPLNIADREGLGYVGPRAMLFSVRAIQSSAANKPARRTGGHAPAGPSTFARFGLPVCANHKRCIGVRRRRKLRSRNERERRRTPDTTP